MAGLSAFKVIIASAQYGLPAQVSAPSVQVEAVPGTSMGKLKSKISNMLFSPDVYHDIIARDESERRNVYLTCLEKLAVVWSALTFPKMTTPLPGPLTFRQSQTTLPLGKPSSLTDPAKFADAGKVTTMY